MPDYGAYGDRASLIAATKAAHSVYRKYRKANPDAVKFQDLVAGKSRMATIDAAIKVMSAKPKPTPEQLEARRKRREARKAAVSA